MNGAQDLGRVSWADGYTVLCVVVAVGLVAVGLTKAWLWWESRRCRTTEVARIIHLNLPEAVRIAKEYEATQAKVGQVLAGTTSTFADLADKMRQAAKAMNALSDQHRGRIIDGGRTRNPLDPSPRPRR